MNALLREFSLVSELIPEVRIFVCSVVAEGKMHGNDRVCE